MITDTSSSHVSTEVIEDEQSMSNVEESDDEEFDTSEDGEESEEEDDVEETMEEVMDEVNGLVGEGGRDDTFDLDEEEEEEEEDEEGLDLDYHELDMMDHDDYIHIDMPSLGFGMS